MKSYRPIRIANVIRQVVSDALATKLADPRIAPMTSVTRVEVTPDLEYAKVYVSVMGEDSIQRRTVNGLQSAIPMLQRRLGQALQARTLPRLTFLLDQSLKQAAETNRLIDESLAEDARRHGNSEDDRVENDAPTENDPGEDA